MKLKTSCVAWLLLLTSAPAWAYKNAGFRSHAEADAYYRRQKDQAQTAFLDRMAEAIRRDPKDPVPHYQVGNFHFSERRYDEAAKHFNAALQADPNFGRAYVHRAMVAWHRNDIAAVAADLKQAVAREPSLADAHLYLGMLHLTAPDERLRDARKARAEVERACELNGRPTFDACLLAAQVCAELGDFEAAVKWQSQAMQSGMSYIPEEVRRTLACYQRGELGTYRPTFRPAPIACPFHYQRGSK